MHIHILGICGTFMAGIAKIARELGHKVTGSDQNIYPPMSTFLESEKIEVIAGFDPKQLDPRPDLVIIGNALGRGNPCVEYILNHHLNFTSAPQWLHDEVLKDRWVIAVAGTHGKTTTSSMVNWILEEASYEHGFLIGGIPGNFEVSARLGSSRFFVIEADEYDTAFFDKRSKFVHYCPETLILNNLEFDHADIFNDLAAIQRQFNHLIRIVPSHGLILSPENDSNLSQVLAMGCWSEQIRVGSQASWQAKPLNEAVSHFEISHKAAPQAEVHYDLAGKHNMQNALMAILAAHHVGVPIVMACHALKTFKNTKRRLEWLAEINGIEIYDDFAHHPTAFFATIEALRGKIGSKRRILVVLEPRSNTMKSGIVKDEIAPSLGQADEIFIYQPEHLNWFVTDIVAQCIQPAHWAMDIEVLAQKVAQSAKEDDVILVMSNGSFQGIHQKIIDDIKKRQSASV